MVEYTDLQVEREAINEQADDDPRMAEPGYLAVALSALATGEIANRFGLRPEPFYL
jgi:hypothetical protein